jgi:hypothetical protein
MIGSSNVLGTGLGSTPTIPFNYKYTNETNQMNGNFSNNSNNLLANFSVTPVQQQHQQYFPQPIHQLHQQAPVFIIR